MYYNESCEADCFCNQEYPWYPWHPCEEPSVRKNKKTRMQPSFWMELTKGGWKRYKLGRDLKTWKQYRKTQYRMEQ